MLISLRHPLIIRLMISHESCPGKEIEKRGRKVSFFQINPFFSCLMMFGSMAFILQQEVLNQGGK